MKITIYEANTTRLPLKVSVYESEDRMNSRQFKKLMRVLRQIADWENLDCVVAVIHGAGGLRIYLKRERAGGEFYWYTYSNGLVGFKMFVDKCRT